LGGMGEIFMQPIKYLNGGIGVSGLNGISGNPPHNNEILYSHEAAATPGDNVIFFDGVDYYLLMFPMSLSSL